MADPGQHSTRVFDSNTLIYYLNGAYSPDQFARVDTWIEKGAALSVITHIEVLGFQQPDRKGRSAPAPRRNLRGTSRRFSKTRIVRDKPNHCPMKPSDRSTLCAPPLENGDRLPRKNVTPL